MTKSSNNSLPAKAGSMSSEDIVSNREEASQVGRPNGATAGDAERQDADIGNADSGYADPQTDLDPRTSNTGFTSIGSSDLNADTPDLPSQEVPGVRMGGGNEAPT